MVSDEQKKGVVSFLDVLGWKGIWVNLENPIKSLNEFILNFQTEAELIYRSLVKNHSNAVSLEIILFSDTIVIFTPDLDDDFSTSLDFHSRACKLALEIGLKHNLPLRGAIGYGEYSYYSKRSITMIGSVIDEISIWSGKVDWIGVILAPSVKFELVFKAISIERFDHVMEYPKIPFKENVTGLCFCVRWGDSKGMELLKGLLNNQRYQPPEVTSKYLNTLLFLESKPIVKASMENIENFVLREGTILEFGDSDPEVHSICILQILPPDSVKLILLNEADRNERYILQLPLDPAEHEHLIRQHKKDILKTLKVGEEQEFKGFSIHVTSIFEGLQDKLVELKVEWKD